MKILNGKQTRDGQPYGSMLTCTMTYEIEFQENLGFRYITQAKNPLTEKMDEPIKSDWYAYLIMIEQEEGNVQARSFSVRYYEDIAQLIKFVKDNDLEFTKEQSKWLWESILGSIRMKVGFAKLRKDVTMAKFLSATKFEEMAAMHKEGADFNGIKGVEFDVEHLNSLKL